MRQTRIWRRGRLRNVTKRLHLLARVLRARPLHQRIALFGLFLAPLLLFFFGVMSKKNKVPVKRPPVTAPEDGDALAPIRADGPILENYLGAAPSKEARIAYFVQVGLDAVPMLPRLFRAMHHPGNVYVVHIDAKVPKNLRSSVERFVASDPVLQRSVHFLQSEMVTYKGVSMVLNTLAGMTLLLRLDAHWDYFINLSGADYPLLSPTNQRRLLARPGAAGGRLNFLTLFPRAEWRPYAFRIRWMHWDPAVAGLQAAGARLRVFRGLREYPLERFRHFTFAKAEAWMVLSRPFVHFVLRSAFAKKMLLNHAHVRSAPEHYFADVLYNHPVWRRTLVPDALRKVVWVHRGRRSGQHPYVLDRSARDPLEFWPYLRETRSLFARKFGTPNSPLLKQVDRRLSGSVLDEKDRPATEVLGARREQQAFYARICAHFDELTQATLRSQNVGWPADAYPEPRAATSSDVG